MSSRALRDGDLVEVAGPSEIVATLDERGALGQLPFMLEMAAFCGLRYHVDRRAEKICDTIHYSGSRRLRDTVRLADLRCDGSAHGGYQADWRFFWKEAWLRSSRRTHLPRLHLPPVTSRRSSGGPPGPSSAPSSSETRVPT